MWICVRSKDAQKQLARTALIQVITAADKTSWLNIFTFFFVVVFLVRPNCTKETRKLFVMKTIDFYFRLSMYTERLSCVSRCLNCIPVSSTYIKASATLQDRPRADHFSAFVFHIIHTFSESLIVPDYDSFLQNCNWVVFCESICLCKFNSSTAENERKRTINIASRHVLLKNRVLDFWHVHWFFFNNRINSEETNHQHFLWKNDDYAKTEKENKNRRHGFRGKLSDNKLAKFQPNGLRGCWLEVKNV